MFPKPFGQRLARLARITKSYGNSPKKKERQGKLLCEILEDRTLPDSAMAALFPYVVFQPQRGGVANSPALVPSGGFTPAGLKQAYGINQVTDNGATMDGTGQTIAIIDAYDDPDLVNSTASNFAYSDLHQFDLQFGLPEPAGFFTKVGQNGGAPPTAVDSSGDSEMEESLDVEWVHALAPGAKIILVEANGDSNIYNLLNNLFTAAAWAGQHSGASVVSMSWGLPESFYASDPLIPAGESSYDSTFVSPPGHGVTFVASTGDSGVPGVYPAYSPNVVAVGGTTLSVDASGNYSSETGWSLGSDSWSPTSAGGGGISSYETQPAYQQGLIIHNGSATISSNGYRTIPDIAFDGDPDSGVPVYDSFTIGGPWWEVGGTSLSAPCWGAIISLADQVRADHGLGSLDGPSQTLPTLYHLYQSSSYARDFHDITSGKNGYQAGTGYDLMAGIGTPIANLLVNDLAQLPSSRLGTLNLVEGPASGTDSDIVATTGSWSATANVSWLHTTSSGTGNGLAIFTFDANSGPTRSGTLTIASQTLTVIQAGSSYVAANPDTTLVSSGLNRPYGVAVDGSGNVYIADTDNNAIKEWSATTQTVSTLVSSGLNQPLGVAVDGAGNVYIADTFNNAIEEWNVTTQTVSTLVSSGLNQPLGVAVDGAGNVYIADANNNAIKEWSVTTQTVTTLVSLGLSYPEGVTVDGAGNVYIADTFNNAIKEWNVTTQTVSTLVSSGLYRPYGVAVDGAGNLYIADTGNNAIKEWSATTQTVSTLVSLGLNQPFGVAVDGAGNLYIADTDNYAIEERPRAFVPSGAVSEGAAAGSDQLLPILPTTELLTGLFAPSSDQAWLTIGNPSAGVISFSFTQNTGAARTANITVLGQQITVTQVAAPPSLGTTSLVEGPANGTDSDIVVDYYGSWSATSNASWLHTTSSGNGNGLTLFTFDANGGATRSGTLTIAGLTLTVTQAGSSYVAANPLSTLVSSGLNRPYGVAVDGSGNVYIADTDNNAIKEWNATTQTVSTLVSSGLNQPLGVAVDGAGNVYIADTFNNAIKEWNVTTQTVSTLVSSGLNQPLGVAVDGAGNVYIADANNNAIKEWNVTTQTVTTLVSLGLSYPEGVAVDGAGNVYIADTFNNAIKKWNVTTQTVSTLVSSGLYRPYGVAVDGAGNLYIADTGNNALKEWSATTQTVSTLVSLGLNQPFGVAVDGAGNVYIADTDNYAIKERPRAFVPGGAVSEGAAVGSDQLLPVLPTTEMLTGIFAPSSDQGWLTLGSPSGGVIPFSFTANTGSTSRTAHITVLGQQITVTQAALPPSLGTTSLVEGPASGTDSDIVVDGGSWSATANASWLHTTSSGTGYGLAIFTFDANSGATRAAAP